MYVKIIFWQLALGKNIANITEDCNCEPVSLTKCYITSSFKVCHSCMYKNMFRKVPVLKEHHDICKVEQLEIPGLLSTLLLKLVFNYFDLPKLF